MQSAHTKIVFCLVYHFIIDKRLHRKNSTLLGKCMHGFCVRVDCHGGHNQEHIRIG